MNYDLADIQSDFITDKLITFKSSSNPYDPVLESELTGTSKSGEYFNRGNDLFLESFQNLEAIAPNFRDWAVGSYSATQTYSSGEIVYSGKPDLFYKSVQNSNTGQALTDVAWWTKINPFSDWLKERIENSIETLLRDSIQATPFIDVNTVWRVPESTHTTTNSGKRVGLALRPKNSENLKMILNRIGLAFKGTPEAIDFKLYHNNTEIATTTITGEADGFKWFDLTAVANMEVKSNEKGYWFLLYDQPATQDYQALGSNTLFPQIVGEMPNIRGVHANFEIAAISVDPATDLRTVTSNDFVYDNNFGINLDFTVKSDLTRWIKENKASFAKALNLLFTKEMLSIALNNPNVKANRNIRNFDKENINYQLKSPDKFSLISKVSREIEALKRAIENVGFYDVAFRKPLQFNYNIKTV